MASNSKVLTEIALASIFSIIGYTIYTNFDKQIKYILITGANKGIGYGIAKCMLQNTSNYHVIISGRNEKKINQALRNLIQICSSYKYRVSTLIMDVSNKTQIEKASRQLLDMFGSDLNLCCIVNNAAIQPEIITSTRTQETAKKTIQTNFWGLVYVTQYFGPLLNDKDSRIVNISSGRGIVCTANMTQEKRDIILNPNIDSKQLEELITDFLSLYEKHTNLNAYGFSKACVNVFTCLIAPKLDIFSKKTNMLINCCTPGFTDTDMVKNEIPKYGRKKTIAEGVRVPMKLIVGDINGQTGKFFGGFQCVEYYLDQYVPVKQKDKPLF